MLESIAYTCERLPEKERMKLCMMKKKCVSGLFQRSRELLGELLGQKKTALQRGGDMRPEQESVFMSVYLFIRLYIAEDEGRGIKVHP